MTRPSTIRAALAALAFVAAAPLAAQQQLQWSGSVRPRSVWRAVGGDGSFFTTMQSRVAVRAPVGKASSIFLQGQDVRTWGGESSTKDASGDMLDLHQAFMEVRTSAESPLWARVGRQEMEYGEGRFVGTPEWSDTNQSFDGVRGSWAPEGFGSVDAFAVQLRESAGGAHEADASLFGVWARRDLSRGTVQLFVLRDGDGSAPSTARTTVGTLVNGDVGVVTWRVEGAYQGGRAAGLDLSASMVAARATAPLPGNRANVTLWYDRYSGDAQPGAGKDHAFSDLYGRNHRFFGAADLFKNIPSDTEGRGIQDLALRSSGTFGPGVRVDADLHRFLVTDASGLGGDTLGDELDLTVRGRVVEGVDFRTGYSRVWLGDAGRAVGVASGDVSFAYLQLQARF